MEYKFHLNNLRIAPRKVRRVADLIKKMPVGEAEAQLKFQNRRAALPILKLLKSGIASAVGNFNASAEGLLISNIFVDEGSMLKRYRPRAFGKAGAIHKKTSRVTLILEEKQGVKIKKSKKSEKESPILRKLETLEKPKTEFIAPKEIKPKRKLTGAARKIFRRKAIG